MTSGTIKLKVNGVEYELGSEVTSSMTLLDFTRKTLHLPGTKYMCREGGCGACTVSAKPRPGRSGFAVNSCLVSVTSCRGWEITTIEDVGNRMKGYHAIQETLAETNGTQCGYCSPGFVMSMYSSMQEQENMTMREIEGSLSGNVCRCTGYRPILQAFKTFGSDAPAQTIVSIEDLASCIKTDADCNKKCDNEDWCIVTKEELQRIFIKKCLKDGKIWYRVGELEDVIKVLDVEGDDSYMLVSGNTAKGAYPISEYPRMLIDITAVKELSKCHVDQNLIVGAGNTITNFMHIFENVSKEDNFSYLIKLKEHLQQVGHKSVRNLASLAGNLMIKHEHREFPSDLFLLLECVGAQLTLYSKSSESRKRNQIVTTQEFMETNMNGKIIVNVLLPPLNDEFKIVTFKVMPRGQSAIAIVNAAFMYQLTESNVVKTCRIVYGGLSPTFTRARNTESILIGKKLFTNDTLQRALKVLKGELIVTEEPPKPSAKYRRQLSLALFYKGLLSLCPKDKISKMNLSGAIKLHKARPLSTGTQLYNTDSSLWPLNEPIPKIDGLIQCAGEAQYTDDLSTLPYEVSAAYVLATVPNGKITRIDASKALNSKGVLAFYSAKDIPGLNSFTPAEARFHTTNEEIFCNGTVKYHSQPIGIVVAETYDIAHAAAQLVEVTYSDVTKPVLTIEEARTDPARITFYDSVDATDRGDDVVKVIKNNNSTFGQYHFMMENIVSLVQPTEEGIKVHATSHWLNAMQLMISRALNINQSKVDVHTRRLGGSYGIKISSCIQSAIACSLAALRLNRPCRFVVSLTDTTSASGKRLPCYNEFEVGVNSIGKIQYMNYDVYDDNGYLLNELFSFLVLKDYYNCYDKSTWNFRSFNAVTDTPSNTWFRAPGTLEAVSMIEHVMEQIAYELQLDPLEVRLANIAEEYSDIKGMIKNIRKNSNYDARRRSVDKFNASNRWKKRGLKLSLMRWSPVPMGIMIVNIAIMHGDGSVIISHGAVDMGQGMNTRAVQVCAYLLNISIDKIEVKEDNTINSPNCFMTAASVGSQYIVTGVRLACEKLLKRLEPLRAQLPNFTWEELIKTAFEKNVDLQARGFVNPDIHHYEYVVFGVAVTEVEVDILTGETEVIRVDLEEDVGQSISPLIDIGQVEGAFIMGLGYWTSEELIYNKTTGKLLTNRTWDYYVPLATDIPQDFRVYFRKKSYSVKEIFGSKGVGEPPICLGVCVTFAIREAIASARLHSGIPTTQWFPIKGPFTVEKIALAAETKIEDFKF